MTTSSPHRRSRRSTDRRSSDRHRTGRDPRRAVPGPPSGAAGAGAPDPAPYAPPATACCAVSTTERRSLGGTVIRTHRHHPRCPVWAAR
ncbi:hypothetical protein ACIQ9P_19325 [Kitasatospora sp. NPDC094019]|uniref:hypothetical protein n=1 Tax=Kitasatospora sp. NPDC094019 TaxID=3364091 RepID=UPI0038151242